MRVLFLLIFLGLSFTIQAKTEMPDYFMTQAERDRIDELRSSSKQDNKTLESQRISYKEKSFNSFKISAILVSENKKLVEINGNYLLEGEEKFGIKVQKINKNSADLIVNGALVRAVLGKDYSTNPRQAMP